MRDRGEKEGDRGRQGGKGGKRRKVQVFQKEC